MNYMILAISMLACLFGGLIKKICGNRFENKDAMYQFYNAVISIISALVLIVVSDNLKISAYTILLGIIFGVITALQSVFNMKAFEKGPYSYTTVIVSLSTIIPALSGYFFWDEMISSVQVIGILLMLLCFICSVNFNGEKKKSSVAWLVYTFITFVCTGLIGVMQKIHQKSAYKQELDGFLVIAFFISFLYSVIGFLHANRSGRKWEKTIIKKEITLTIIVFMVMAGVCVAANNKMNLYLSGVMDSAIFFPTVNGGGLVLSTIASQILFKEKLSKRQWIGVAFGIVAVVLLCNPF